MEKKRGSHFRKSGSEKEFTLKVNEIFDSIQGEGFWTGRRATFIRLSGCSLNCDWCDTDYKKGEDLTIHEILQRAKNLPFVVITGGEPTDQRISPLIAALKARNHFVQVETNGCFKEDIPSEADWITISPKGPIKFTILDELKIVYRGQDISEIATFGKMNWKSKCLQPLCGEDDYMNVGATIEAIDKLRVEHGQEWMLSVQVHKLIGVR